VLTNKQITELSKVLDGFLKNKQPRAENKPHLTYGISFQHIEKKLGPILDDIIGPCSVVEVLLQRVVKPHSIHNDYQPPVMPLEEGQTPGWAVLFPLRSDGTSHTIVFPEQSKNPSPAEDDAVTGYVFTEEEKKLLSHAPDYSMQRVSSPVIIKWSAGDVIAWDRKNFHSSDNFLEHGTTYKDSVILFTNR
tara:strand:+ start:272 stop:844 length:573 start_codon:yes stop_codon:yes gene_type:complete